MTASILFEMLAVIFTLFENVDYTFNKMGHLSERAVVCFLS
ncbi:hypothetical protein [Paenibacillus sp. 481]|nr:hypothetical protein [Paenibacillus sp. 481]